jgi:hypothetical protein
MFGRLGNVARFNIFKRLTFAVDTVCVGHTFRINNFLEKRYTAALTALVFGSLTITACVPADNSSCDTRDNGDSRSLFLHESEKPHLEVDFVVIGNGNAGNAATRHLESKCPKAKILCIDPYIQNVSQSSSAMYKQGNVIRLNHSQQTIDILSSVGTIERIRFKHSILIATGVRGAPPPVNLVDERVTDRILELRSTQMFSLQNLIKDGIITPQNHQYPSIPKQSVRQIALLAASQGARLCILGSDLEAIEIAASASRAQHKKQSNRNTEIRDNISLICGGAGPLGHSLPRYLSTSVSKRLRYYGISCEDRSLVRYIAAAASGQQGRGNVEVYLSKSFDSLETKRCTADLVIVAPRVLGQSGCAAIPTLSLSSLKPRETYRPWSRLTALDEHVISCYADDGRIAVNSELNAASNVYAAGSVAKYPNHRTGHATVCGEGIVEASAAGLLAADNMAKDYFTRTKSRINKEESRTNIFSKTKSLPVLRTDRLWNVSDERSALSNLGIHALFVGNCDSETMSTHGFWWTNQSRRLSRIRSGAKNNLKSIYGSGFVYYLDRAGTIRGIMVWGLPFADKDGALNYNLVERLKSIINSNGEILQRDHKDLIEQMNLDNDLLYTEHLAEESKALVSMLLSASKRVVTRPMYRFMASKPVSITSLGVLRKSAMIGNGGIAEDIFERSTQDLGHFEGERLRHPSLVHYFDPSWHFELEELQRADEKLSKHPDYAARPPKEEMIWLRKDEVSKTSAVNEKLSEQFMQNIRKGVFNDGTEAVKQAPPPDFFGNVGDERNER